MCKKSICITSFVLVLGMALTVSGAQLYIENHSFELPELPEGDGVYGDQREGEEMPGWSEGRQLHRQGLYYPWALDSSYPHVPDGYQYAFLRSYATVMQDGIWQILSDTYQASPYTLTFDAASVSNTTGNDTLQFTLFAGDKAKIVAQDSVSFAAKGDFDTYTLEVVISPGDPAIGQAIGIWFQNTTANQRAYICIDNVRLETPRAGASIPSPADGDLLGDTSLTLSWRPGDYAVSHKVYIDDNYNDVSNDNAEFIVETQETNVDIGITGSPYPDGLTSGITYYWRVDEVNDANALSPWKGDVWSFTILPKTAWNPTPLDAYQFADPNVDLSWNPGINAVTHAVYFGTDINTVTNAEGHTPTPETTYDPGLLAKDTMYYWRVDTFDGTDTHKGNIWSFKTISDISITNPNLVGWYKFDEGAGTKVVDFSGHENHGTLNGDPQWIAAGYDGGALDFDGDADHVKISRTVQDNFTLMAWVKTDTPGMQLARNDAYVGSGLTYSGISTGGNENDFALAVLGTKLSFSVGGPRTSVNSDRDVVTGEWIHVAGVRNVAERTISVYIHGLLDKSAVHENTGPLDANPIITIGGNTTQSRYYAGLIDDVRIYDKALTQDEINQVMRVDPLLAWNPNPTNGSTPNIKEATPLSWSPGDKASEHDVYFGTDRDALSNADTTDTTDVYRGRQSLTSYTPTEGVEWGGGPYYWRIDEYNTDATISTGRVWTFTVADFVAVDDFESYNDLDPTDPQSNRIFLAWLDGYDIPTNGSLVGYEMPPFCEQTIVNSGNQSMPLSYNNTSGAEYSEAELPLSPPQNWTQAGAATLVLYFHGTEGNIGQLYVKVNGTKVIYGGDAADIAKAEWKQWNIDLAPLGVDLQNVTKLAFGIDGIGASGTLYVDDIRLYRLAPQPEAP